MRIINETSEDGTPVLGIEFRDFKVKVALFENEDKPITAGKYVPAKTVVAEPAKGFERHEIKGSSLISVIAYLEADKLLRVRFTTTGEMYEYRGIGRTRVDNLLGAHSVGSYFSRYIRNKYQTYKLVPAT